MNIESHEFKVIYREVKQLPTNTFFNLSDQKKNRVIEAAVDEFASKGYTKASITNIVNKAEIAKGSFYQYFEGKDDLYKYILEKAVQEELKYIKKEIEDYSGEDFFKYWRRIIMAGLEYANDNIKLAQIASDIVKYKNKEIYQPIIDKYESNGVDLFERLLKKGVNKGQIRKDINIYYTARLINKTSFFITDYFFENRDKKPLDEFEPKIDKIIEIIGCGIKKEGGKENATT